VDLEQERVHRPRAHSWHRPKEDCCVLGARSLRGWFLLVHEPADRVANHKACHPRDAQRDG